MPKLKLDGPPVLDYTVHQDALETFTTVVIVGERCGGIGVAKRHPDDVNDPQFGFDVAFARALRDMADSVDRRIRA